MESSNSDLENTEPHPQSLLPEFHLLINKEDTTLTQAANDALTELFIMFDDDEDNILNEKEIRTLHKKFNMTLAEEDYEWLFKAYSQEQERSFNIEEFLDMYFQRAWNYPKLVYEQLKQVGISLEDYEDPIENEDNWDINIQPISFALKYNPPQIALFYRLLQGSMIIDKKVHTMIVENLTKFSDSSDICKQLQTKHAAYLASTTTNQIIRLIERLKERL